MKFSSLVSLVVIALAGTHSTQAAIISTFDADAGGWSPGVSTALAHQPAGGNPGGFIQVSDAGAVADMTIHAPGAFLGNLTAFNGGTFSFDLNPLDLRPNVGTGCCIPSFGTVVITGSAGFAQLDFVTDLGPDLPTPGWRHYVMPFTATQWNRTEAQWLALLADVDELTFLMEGVVGDEFWGLDNIRVGEAPQQAPEPATVWLLIASLIVALRFRQHGRRPR